ncbi:MAG: hypothetical protein MUF83_12985 [Acidimicrobiales bacterium]|nr:hypothetical protein [Acidimicrobiales bacterium]
MATVVDGDVKLAPLTGESRSLEEWVTTFHLALVVLDPYTYESSWILPTAGRILRVYADADCRTAFLVTCNAKDARRFLGPWVDELLVFTDPDRAAVKAMGLETLPAFVHVNQARAVEVKAEGWDPEEWRAVAQNLSTRMGWGAPTIPEASDPAPFEGTPALG